MPRRITARTVTLWRERIQRFHSSDLSVEAFCRQEALSSSSFYNWRKKLESDEPVAASTSSRCGAFEPMALIASTAGMSIVLPGGARIEIAAGQIEMARTVVSELSRSGVATC